MSYIVAVILGLVQGIAEFLPISSSGHLAIFGSGQENFDLYAIVMFHAGTLLAILFYYCRDVVSLVGGAARLVAAAARAPFGGRGISEFLETDAAARMALLVVVGSVPTAVIGLMLENTADYAALPGHAKFIGACFIITGILVYLCDRLPIGTKGIGGTDLFDALVVGMFQGLAVLPGLSRSGLTIFAGVMRGVERRDAARLSFLMAIPAMIGALLLEARKGSPGGGMGPALVGAAVAFVSGYLSIIVLIRFLAERKMRYFASYVFLLGVFVVIWLN